MHSSPRRRPPNLNLNTAAVSSSSASSNLRSRHAVPQTPPSRKQPLPRSRTTASSRALKVPNATRHADDSFLDSTTPVDADSSIDMSNKENGPPEVQSRDSHDLSLPLRQGTRDSLMASMLLSLDQLSVGQGSTGGTSMAIFEEPSDGYSSYGTGRDDRTWTSMSKKPRSNTRGSHATSQSSDLDVGDDVNRINRGRRSNSSSNFQSGLGRVNSMRESMRSQPSTPRHMHSRGKSGKSSGSNSIDAGYAQVLGSQRWASGFGGRSSSFDHGHRRSESSQQQKQQQQQAPWHIEFSNSFLNEEYDAAPTPTVPGGPRRTAPSTPATASFPHTEPPPEPKTPALERKRSTRSARSSTLGRKGESKFNASREPVPPVPAAFDLDSAPAPHVGYEKSKEPVHSAPTATHATATHTKEKPGFFRRVFGSSKTNLSSNTLESHHSSPQFSTTSIDTPERPGSKTQHIASQMKPHTPPSRDTSSSHSHHHHHHHHVLQKKPSSFFRRRKKSTSDHDPPPVPSPENAPPMPPLVPPISLFPSRDKLSTGPEPSPVSSLRRVMNPYLKGSPTTSTTQSSLQSPPPLETHKSPLGVEPTSTSEPVEGYKRDFSPDYEPSPKAVIRAVEEVRSEDAVTSDTDAPTTRRTDTPTRPPPEPPVMTEKRNNSFLHLDGPSDTDPEIPSPPTKTKPKKPAPLDVAASLSSQSCGTAEASPSAREKHDDTLRAKKRRPGPALDAAGSDEESVHANLTLPIEGARSMSRASESTGMEYKSASSLQESPTIEVTSEKMESRPLDEPDFVVGDPTDDDRLKAQQFFDGNEDFIQKEKAAAWMGEEGVVRQRTLRAYIELYDFKNRSIIDCLRQICSRLVLRAETQQVDRILVAFSTRWVECNPNHGFKSTDVIHMICYSIMLLNTDLHLADIDAKMTRSQFVKNTMTTVKHALEELAPDAFERPSILPGKNAMLEAEESKHSMEHQRSLNRLSFLPTSRAEPESPREDCGPLVKTPFDGSMRAWEGQLEIVLKDIYASIRDERLPLFGAEPERYQSGTPSQSSLSVMGMLKRTPSVLSKAPSESQSSLRGRVADMSRTSTSRWGSKSRSRPRFGGTGFSSSRTSFDDGNSVWSPATSSATWSRYSLGRTQTSMSMDSFGNSWPREYKQSIGFANALGQAIIREDVPGSASILSDEMRTAQLLEDESLQLAGPPWVKEGMVIHKHHLDGIDKKAKERNWSEVFAVIQKGYLSLFSFAPNKSLRKQARSARNNKAPIQVGGGNWQDNATNLGSFNLRQTLASALPPPGYSRSRPHVWALSLPTGAVHLFQVGTPEIIKEFVTTANYWSARLSTHPLVGGISNVEYGWSDAIVNNSLVAAINESSAPSPPAGRTSRPGSSATGPGTRRSSGQSGSYRSASFEQSTRINSIMGSPGSGSRFGKLPGDRIHIAEWAPPTQSLRASNAGEEEQLQTLVAYVKGIEEELQLHNQLRSPMLLAFSPRGHNAAKAMANWERKSAYLLREIVKFRTYVDCLQQAEAKKKEIYKEREGVQDEGDSDDHAGGGDSIVDADEEGEGDTTLRA